MRELKVIATGCIPVWLLGRTDRVGESKLTLGGGLASKEQISLKPLPSCMNRLRKGKVKRGALSAGSS